MKIQMLSAVEAIRKRPGMYVGDTSDGSGLHHLLYWVFDDVLDNARAGRGSVLKVWLCRDGSCRITDNGPALPEPDKRGGGVVDRLERLTAELPVGGERGIANPVQMRSYLPLLRALTSRLDIHARVHDEVYARSYERGEPVDEWHPTERMPPIAVADTQFMVEFWPDTNFFKSTEFDVERVRTRLQQMAATCTSLQIDLSHEIGVPEPGSHIEHLRMPNGMADMVELVAAKAGEDSLEPTKPFRLRVHQGELAFDVAVQWHWGFALKEPMWLSWANTVKTSEGSHVLGVRDAIKAVGLDDVPHIAMISVFVPQPRFTSPTKGCLRNPEIRVLLRDHLTPALRRLAENDEFALKLDWMRTRRAQLAAERGE